MPVKSVPTLGWTRGSVAATISLVTAQQRRDIAARVREGMAREGLTNASLARRADLSEKTISRLINAKLEPRYDTLDRVAKALKMTEKELRGAAPAPLGLGVELPTDELSDGDRLAAIEGQLAGIRRDLDELLGYRREAQQQLRNFTVEDAREFLNFLQEVRARQGERVGKRELQARAAMGR